LLRERVEIVGTPIDFVDMEPMIERLVGAACQRQFFQVATVNLDFLVHSQRDHEVGNILSETAINIADGAPVVWAGRLVGLRGISRVAGADLVPRLMGRAAAEGLRVFFLGGEHGAAFEASRRLEARYPGLEVAVMEPPRAPLEQMDDVSILSQIEAVRPHILLVAFGHPKQEKWIYRNRHSLPLVSIGVGCCFDLIAGRQSRAPRWVRALNMEWGYRLVSEPHRLVGRYSVDAVWLLRHLVPWALAARFHTAG
jgi:N-acetylglucosaminyldiphosphoundecaprenol N-acetyl-beta-D-mannosaminyltransferase